MVSVMDLDFVAVLCNRQTHRQAGISDTEAKGIVDDANTRKPIKAKQQRI
jgi:hypothetical protein